MMIWNKEKGTAAAVITLSWLAKIYFSLLLYSYATHLRKGSYRSLPLSRPNTNAVSASAHDLSHSDEDCEDFQGVPFRTARYGANHHSDPSHDRVGGPGRSRRTKSGSGRSLPNHIDTFLQLSKSVPLEMEMEEEVLFDEDELAPKLHSKTGTETSLSSPDDEW